MLSPFRHRLAVLLPAAALALAAIAVASPASAHAANPVGIKALAFASRHTDARTASAVDLTWTVTDSDGAASTIFGDVQITMQSTVTGAFLGDVLDVPYQYQNTGLAGFATYLSGTPQKSTYSYSFAVPQYADAATARWVVTEVTAQDSDQHSLTLTGTQLRPYQGVLVADELVDSTGPTLSTPTLHATTYPWHPYVYVKGDSSRVIYEFTVRDVQSGFWKGTLTLRGPSGQTVSQDFAYTVDATGGGGANCGYFYGGDIHEQDCGVVVTLPVDAVSGVWSIATLTVLDNANNRTTVQNPDAPTFTATSNDVLSASGFSATPTSVDDWRQAQTVQIGMRVTGAVGGVSAIIVDAGGQTQICAQSDTTPTVQDDGMLTVTLRMSIGTPECDVLGIAIVDGAGDVALYGANYGAPDPGVTVTNIPDAPPVATSATLNVTSLPLSQVSSTSVTVTVTLAATPAPVTMADAFVYDATGAEVNQSYGGSGEYPQGTVTIQVPLYNVTVGTYTIGFLLHDAGYLDSFYGTPSSPPVPGGPLTLTITEG